MSAAARSEIIEDGDGGRRAIGQQAFNEVGADEPGSAGDEYVHRKADDATRGNDQGDGHTIAHNACTTVALTGPATIIDGGLSHCAAPPRFCGLYSGTMHAFSILSYWTLQELIWRVDPCRHRFRASRRTAWNLMARVVDLPVVVPASAATLVR
jgi:hypothetical protein